MKIILRKIMCLLIAFMMIIPAIPGNYADAAEVIKADKVYKKDIDFTSTNKQSNLQGFWKKGNDAYFAITVLHSKSIVSASYTSTDVVKTVTGSAIQHLDGVTRIEVKDKSNSNIIEFIASKENNQEFVIICFENSQIENIFDLQIDIDHGKGHEFNSVDLIVPKDEEPNDEKPGDEKPGDDEPKDDEIGDDEPGDDEPKDDEPGDEEPKGEDLVNEDPVNEDPVNEDPKDEDPKDEEPVDEEQDNSEPNNNKSDKKDRSSGGTIINDMEVPLAELEKTDHFAYVIGYPEGAVKPLDKITRQEVAMIFFRLLTDESRIDLLSETNTFIDVDSQLWSNIAVSTLYNADIIKGYPDGTFRPTAPITRAEFATIAAKFDNLELGNTSKFTDIEGHWAEDYITSSEIKGWIKGYPDLTFKPNEDITRAEAMALINNVLGRSVPTGNIHPDAIAWSDIKETDWYYSVIMEATNSHDYIIEDDGIELWTGIKANKVWP